MVYLNNAAIPYARPELQGEYADILTVLFKPRDITESLKNLDYDQEYLTLSQENRKTEL